MTLPEDTILENRYRIDRLLAHGGMGAIYQAFDTNLNIPVAIKENFLQTPESIRQFQQEALILARLRHPSLPRVIHHFSFEGQQYLVMDFVEGKNLWEIVKSRRRPMEEKQALKYLIEVCGAVSYLHSQDPPIIHRDIKPQNIKVTPDKRAVLVDFGIAKIGSADTKTRTGAQGITPGFSPPEQYSGAGTTPLSDVYALGATLYALLTGKKPPDSISLLVSKTKFEPPNVVNTALSNRVSDAIVRAMQPQPEDRPPSVAAWQKELEAILESLLETAADDERETLTPGTVLSPFAVSTTAFWLVDSSGKGYEIGPTTLVMGRHADADIVVKVMSASRQHALIRREGDHCLVMDNGSANGTFLNDRRLGLEWQQIKPGDVLAIGSARFTLTQTAPGEPVPAAPPAPSTPVVEEKTVYELPTQPSPSTSRPAPVAPPPPPAPSRHTGALLLTVLIVALILLGVVGAVAYFLYTTNIATSATATAISQQVGIVAQTLTAEAVQQEQADAQTATAQAQAGAQATANAESTLKAEQATVAAATAAAGQTATAAVQPTATRTPTPIPTQSESEPADTATPTRTAATATQTPAPATATATKAAVAAPAGPTLIPLKSDVSLPEIGSREVTDVDINPKNPREVYVLVKGDGIYKSVAGGEGPFARMKLDAAAVTSVVLDPVNPARLFASTWNAVLRTDDGGNTWKAFSNGLSSANQTVDVVAVDPSNPDLLYAGIGITLVVSTDGGENWTSEGFGQGLGAGRFTSIVVDPFNNDIVYAAGEFGSIYRSVDSGRNFIQLAFGTGRGTYGMAAHPTQKGVYLVGINSFDAGIIKTENGADFQSVSNGLVFGGGDSAYCAIVYAPGNPNIVYAGSGYEDDRNAKGIFKSVDGGKSWERISNGLNINPATGQPHYVKSIAVHPTNPDIALAATGGGLFKTTDGGKNWSQK